MTVIQLGTRGPVTRTDIVRYAGASGDFLPLHHDESLAQQAGFPTVFAMGMYPAGLLANALTDLVGTEAVRRYRVRFREQVWPGDVLQLSGTVREVSDHDTEHDTEHVLVTLDLMCRREAGGEAITAQADLVLDRTTYEALVA